MNGAEAIKKGMRQNVADPDDFCPDLGPTFLNVRIISYTRFAGKFFAEMCYSKVNMKQTVK
jgi:hypothetical protein